LDESLRGLAGKRFKVQCASRTGQSDSKSAELSRGDFCKMTTPERKRSLQKLSFQISYRMIAVILGALAIIGILFLASWMNGG
jgi:hypothetical protein